MGKSKRNPDSDELRLMVPEDDEESQAFELVQNKLNEVKSDVPGYNWLMDVDDVTVLRFLRGNKNDAELAFEKLLAAAKWRKEYMVDQVLYEWPIDNSPEAMLVKTHWPMGIAGEDKRGRPVQINRIGLVDFPGLYKKVGEYLMIRHNVFYLEKNLEMNPSIQSVLILDLGHNEGETSPMRSRLDVTWLSKAVAFLRSIAHIFDHYPEMLHRILVVRYPYSFYFGWNFYVKYMVNERTREKLVFIPRAKLKEGLLDYMDEDAIPKELGGRSPVMIPLGGLLDKN